jgi:hypothetical protein
VTVSIVTWVWDGGRDYAPEHVAVLGRMLARHMTVPYRLIAIADDIRGDWGAAEVIETPPAARALARLETPEKKGFPSSYRRLWMFSREAAALGPRLMVVDLDIAVTGDWAPLLDVDVPFIGWRPGQAWPKPSQEIRLAGGQYLLRAGEVTQVWDRFEGTKSILEARKANYRGSDQAWISYCLAGTAPVWPKGCGIYSIRDMTRDDRQKRTLAPPADARVVHFNGRGKPWHAATRAQHPWVGKYWK